MKTEVLCNEANFSDVLLCLFESACKKVDTICLPAGSFKNIDSDFINHHLNFSAIVDYPLGISDTQIRIHEIILAANRGIKCIDLVINTYDLESGNTFAIAKDFKHCYALCTSKGISIRPVIEYRASDDNTIFDVAENLLNKGANELVVGTGSMVDDITDNIIVSKLIEKRLNINVISCSPILCQDHYQLFQDSNIAGIRIKSFKILDNLCINN
jgi:deoxyribose-phosphate aldolase|tara:strand:+ start:1955 stop:2596 length:642 start_codon:yes stop_codon:yes gene_type:complete